MTIELDDATAALLYDICFQMDNNLEGVVFVIREAIVALPKLEEAFAKAGVDIDSVERPEIPKLKPGRKWKPPTDQAPKPAKK
jgi:hypothetical protein